MSRLSKLPWLEISILILAAAMRIAFLDIKPPHFDEGINGWFADQMTRAGYYKYDPGNYHGPLHFYGVFLSQTLFGRNLWALRLPAIIPAILGVWVMLRMGRYFGPATARWAALAMAVSPAFVFYGRYSIHESWQVLFLLLFLRGVLGLWEKGDARSIYWLILSAAGMVLTKETYILHLASFGLAAGVLAIFQKLVPSNPAMPVAARRWTWQDFALASAWAIFAIIFFYSGTFQDWKLLAGLYQTFQAWVHTGTDAAGHAKADYDLTIRGHKIYLNYYWVYLMARYEWPALIGLAACVRYIWPSDARLRYLAIYAGGVLLAYSQIQYKTPWCIISIIWPFFLLFGAIISEAAKRARPFVMAAAGVIVAVSLVTSIRLNYFAFTDERHPYVYVQTYSEIDTLTQPLLEMAKKDPRYYHLQGLILLDSYYPLPWILGDFTELLYYKLDTAPVPYTAAFVIADRSKDVEVEARLQGAYYKRHFHLRDAQAECTVYFAAKDFAPWFGGATPDVVGGPVQ